MNWLLTEAQWCMHYSRSDYLDTVQEDFEKKTRIKSFELAIKYLSCIYQSLHRDNERREIFNCAELLKYRFFEFKFIHNHFKVKEKCSP